MTDATRSAKAIGILALLALAGCDKTGYGPELMEAATVVDLPYVPAGHGSSVGFSSGGSLVVSGVDIPERKAIVFQCQHGRFVIDRHPEIWGTLTVGQRVTVRYREVYTIHDDGTRNVRDLDFLGVTP